MSLARQKRAQDPEAEYKAIEKALLESARGRWFLSEHSRRARRLDSLTLHDAISKLQETLREPPALLSQLRTEIEELQSLLRETRAALTAKQTAANAAVARALTGAANVEAGGAAPPATDAGATAVNGQTSATQILSVAEAIHNLAWDLQAQEVNVDACEAIARQASQMYALSHRHAVESERIRALTDTLDSALHRLDGLLETVAMEAQYDTFTSLPDDDSAYYDNSGNADSDADIDHAGADDRVAMAAQDMSLGQGSGEAGTDDLDAFEADARDEWAEEAGDADAPAHDTRPR